MLLLSATPWSEAPGEESTLARLLSNHAWFNQFQDVLGWTSLLLNVVLICAAILWRKKFFHSRLPAPPWHFDEALQIMALYGMIWFGMFILSAVIRKEFGGFLTRQGFGEAHQVMVNMALSHLIALFAIWWFSEAIRKRTGQRLSHYWRGGDLRGIGLGIPLYIAVVAPVAFLIAFSAALFHQLGFEFDSQSLVLKLRESESPWFVILISISAIGVAPLVEEILFRGILYPTLRARWGIFPAIALNSMLFGLCHFHPPSFLPLMGLAVFFSIALEVTGSLAACIVAHSLFNASTILMIWLLRNPAV